MFDLVASTVVTYASLSFFGFGMFAASALSGPARLAAVAMTLIMVAAPYSNLNGPRL